MAGLASTDGDRLRSSTDEEVRERIDEETRRRVEELATRSPQGIEQRIHELETEWDVERVLEANAATLSLAGAALAVAHDRRWLALPAAVSAFLLQHAIQGWCPPLPLIRRLGVRTRREIDAEKTALRVLRGDFHGLPRNDERARVEAVLERV